MGEEKNCPSFVNKKTERLNDIELYAYRRAAISILPLENTTILKLGMMGNIQFSRNARLKANDENAKCKCKERQNERLPGQRAADGLLAQLRSSLMLSL